MASRAAEEGGARRQEVAREAEAAEGEEALQRSM